MRIAIVSCINEFQSAYSIATMTEAKLKAIQLVNKYGCGNDFVYIKPESGVTPDFWTGEVRNFKEFIPLKDWCVEEIGSDFYVQLKDVCDSFMSALEGVDVAITDDFLLQGWYLPYLIAVRMAEKAYGLKVYHNNHSCPSKRKELLPPRDELFRITENEYILYNNNSDIPDEEEMYKAYGRVLPIFNPLDIPKFYRFPKVIEDFYYKYQLYKKEIVSVYPCRLSSGKQLEKWLTVMASLKDNRAKVFAIIADAYGTGVWEVSYRQKLHEVAKSLGLVEGEDYVFTSETIEGCNLYTPYEYVSCLYSISNLFVQTSISETYSLIMLEAMASKNFVVLNEDLRYILTNEVGKYSMKAKFGSLLYKTTYFPSFKQYCNDLAKNIINIFRDNSQVKNFIWASRNNNLLRYAYRLLSHINYDNSSVMSELGKEVNDDLVSVILDDVSEVEELVVKAVGDKGMIPINPTEV